MMRTQKLKLGLLLDSFDVPAWLFHALEQLANSDYAEFSVIFLKDGELTENSAAGIKKLWKNRQELAYQLFNKLDEKVFLKGPNAFELVNLQKLLAGVRVVSLRPIRDGDFDVIQPEDVRRVWDCRLDILIQVGFQRLCGEMLTAAKYGVWVYAHGRNRGKQGSPPGFWEVVEGQPVTESALVIAKEDPNSAWAVYRSRTLTYPFSPARNRNTAGWLSASFLPRQIELLHRLGEARFFQETARFNGVVDFCDCKQHQPPGSLDCIRFYTRLLIRNLYELYQRVSRREGWYLMVDFSNNPSLPFANYQKVEPPKDRFWADPHVIRQNDKYFIFVEEYIYKNRKGHIAVIEMDSQGNYQAPVPVLVTDYHLSYPFVFEYGGKYYMVPESSSRHSIDLYECEAFPTRWTYKMSLMENVMAVDTTLFFHLGKWWLFTGITQHAGALPEVELFLFSADDLFTMQWSPHPLNPVMSDVTCARPAGSLFTIDGKIYRPSQDCSRNYGYGFNINEVHCLTETGYLEKKVAAVKPNWDRRLIATHTFTRGEGIQVIDALTRRSKLG